VIGWLQSLEGHWLWLTLGLVLAGLEMIVPGVYLIWLALAALVTGGLVFVAEALPGSGLSAAAQVISFAIFSLIFLFSARRWLRASPIVSADPMLNNRTGQLLGQTALVTQAIAHGSGRVKLGDSEWTARGADAAAGDYVVVCGAEGQVLLVEPANL